MSISRPVILLALLCVASFPPLPTRSAASDFYPSLFYPGSPDTSGALKIHLDPGSISPQLILAPRSSGGSVAVRILDASDGSPVSGILVEASVGRFEAYARTDADGRAVVTGVTPGKAVVTARPDDPRSETGAYAVASAPSPIEVRTDVMTDVGEIRLGTAGRIKARVWRPAGTVWPQIPVVLRSVDGSVRRVVRTADDGRASFGGLAPGPYRLWADTRGTDAVSEAWDGSQDTLASTPLAVEAGSLLTPIEIHPNPGGVISGAIRDRSTNAGLPVVVVRVVAQRPPGTVYPFLTDSLGYYFADGLPSGSYKVNVPALLRWYPDASSEGAARAVTAVEGTSLFGIDVSGDPLAACTTASRRPCGISGAIRADFNIMPSATVVAWNDADTIRQIVRRAGSYTVTCVPPGSYKVVCIPDGSYRTQYHRSTFSPDSAIAVAVAEGDTARGVDFELQRSIVLEGLVQDDRTGAPLAGIRVIGTRSGRDRVESVTDAAGAFRLDRLADGSGLPSGDWIVGSDSAVVGEIAPTLVRAIGLEATRAGRTVRVAFQLPLDLAITDWRLERRCGDAIATIVSDAASHPDGTRARDFMDPDADFDCAYRLAIDDRPEGGGEWIVSAWISAGPAPRLLFPSPWDGRTRLRLPESAATGASCMLLAPDGSRALDLRARGSEVTPPAGAVLASGVYFLRWRTASGTTRTARIVVQR